MLNNWLCIITFVCYPRSFLADKILKEKTVMVVILWCWIYNYLCNQCLSPLMLWVRISIRARCTTLCDQVCQWLTTGRRFSPGPLVSSTNKTECHDITEILLKVALNTVKQIHRMVKKNDFGDLRLTRIKKANTFLIITTLQREKSEIIIQIPSVV